MSKISVTDPNGKTYASITAMLEAWGSDKINIMNACSPACQC